MCNPSMPNYDPGNPGCLVYNLLQTDMVTSRGEEGEEAIQRNIKVCLSQGQKPTTSP